MAKAGRPRKNGEREGWTFSRAAVGLCAFDQARSAGEKYSVALQAAVTAVRQKFPGMRISEGHMKRILLEFRPKGSTDVLLVDENPNAGTLDGSKVRRWDLRFGPRPNYPRHNASDNKKKK